MQRLAAERDSRMITVAQFLLFSTDTGDAWLLDWSDQLAAPIARDGSPQPVHIEETNTQLAVAWKGHYQIDGPAFVYADEESGRPSPILGYPTRRIAEQIAKLNSSAHGFFPAK